MDELGGYATALRVTRATAKIPADSRIILKVFPARKSTVRVLLDWFVGRDDDGTGVRIAHSWKALEALQPLVREVREMLQSSREVLSMQPIQIRPFATFKTCSLDNFRPVATLPTKSS